RKAIFSTDQGSTLLTSSLARRTLALGAGLISPAVPCPPDWAGRWPGTAGRCPGTDGRWPGAGGRCPVPAAAPDTPGRCCGREGAPPTRGAAAGCRTPPGTPLLGLGYESELLTRYLRCCLRPARHCLMTHLTPGPVLILPLRSCHAIRHFQPTLRHPARKPDFRRRQLYLRLRPVPRFPARVHCCVQRR